MQLASAFWAFKTFAAAVEIDLFTRLRDGRRVTVSEIATELGIHERPSDVLLAACASLGLLDRNCAGYGNSAVAEEFLVSGRPCYFGGYVRFLDHREYPAWHGLVCALRDNRPLTSGPDEQESIFLTDDTLPNGHDVVLLSMILHDWDEITGRALLRKCREALEPGGVILIVEWLLNAQRTGPAAAALMGMNMIVETVGGRNYSKSEYVTWSRDVGFQGAHIVHFDAVGANGAVVDRKH
ncbi:methyltransferase [Amycolatopsis panacis]|uniref:Methyltransferase n=2 Tax=Amycolatopsis panacis TaxID=2340917 RepID=A0A419HTX0_9PSEU|nr:methyltransferase [Amycolatopsis panacis]